MDKIADLTDALDDWLEPLDEMLAGEGVRLADRPFRAAMTLLCQGIVRVSGVDISDSLEAGEAAAVATTPGFKVLYRSVDAWYRDRFGDAAGRRAHQTVGGVVLIRGTPFAIQVPTTLVRPAEPGETIWVSCPEAVEADDDVEDWLTHPPNLQRLDRKGRAALDAQLHEIGGALRFLHANLMGVKADDDTLAGLRAGIVPHFERAAELIAAAAPEGLPKAWWELQMAIESAAKLLVGQKTGSYARSHAVADLVAAAAEAGADVAAGRLAAWPAQNEILEMRYGRIARREIAQAFEAYREALAFAIEAVDALGRIRFGQARFKLRRPPWLADD